MPQIAELPSEMHVSGHIRGMLFALHRRMPSRPFAETDSADRGLPRSSPNSCATPEGGRERLERVPGVASQRLGAGPEQEGEGRRLAAAARARRGRCCPDVAGRAM